MSDAQHSSADSEAQAEVAATTAPAAADNDETEPSKARASASATRSQTPEQGEIEDDADGEAGEESHEELLRKHRWCKCACDPAQFNGQAHYYLHMDTQQSQWTEPDEPFWIWDAATQAIDPRGLQRPSAAGAGAAVTSPGAAAQAEPDPDPEYQGYNPRIHGNYDPNAPYAKYHNQKRQREAQGDEATDASLLGDAQYAATGTFNRFTGAYQTAEQSADRHNDYNKSGRQMGAYFDVDAAANAHDGRSLKEERRNAQLSKKQIKEMAEKRRAKKEKKRLDFYKS